MEQRGVAGGDVVLRPELAQELERIGSADILVGIPSYNNANTIAHVVRAVSGGLAKYYPDRSCVVMNSDGGSKDGTPQIVLETDTGEYPTLLVRHRTRSLHRVATNYVGLPGKGSAFRTIFRVAERLGAKACAVVDSDLRSITPEWIQLLIAPVLDEGMDYVAPLYSRHKYDGTITNSIVYPLTRALYGQRVRQPIGGDFGFSGRLAGHLFSAGAWDSDVARYGIDIWMTTTAIAGGYRVCQSYLGAKIHDAKDPGSDLSAMFTQVVGTVFDLMEQHEGRWTATAESREVPAFGFRYTVGVEPVPVNTDRMIGVFRQGVKDLMSLWRSMLSGDTCRELEVLGGVAATEFRFPAALWVRAVYEAAASYHHRALARDHLLKAMIPLYLGRTAGFVLQTAASDGDAVEREIEALGEQFEAEKPYLLECWRTRRG
jgi:glycosyltransferase involved in cell wall biosynthesis